MAQLEPTEVKPWGTEIYNNVGMIADGEEKVPASLALVPSANIVAVTKGASSYVWLEIGESTDLSDDIAARLKPLIADLQEGIVNPAAYRERIGPQIEGYFADQVGVKFPRRYCFEPKVLAERRRRLEAVERYAATVPGMAADKLTIAQFVDIVLRLCELFTSDGQFRFNKRYYRELLAASDSEEGIWERRLEAIAVDGTNFVNNYLGSQVKFTIGKSGGTNPLTARINLAQVQRIDHGYAPIRNRFWIIPISEGGKYFLSVEAAQDSNSSQPFLEALELLMNAGMPIRIDDQIKKWVLAEDLVKRSVAEARRLNVPAAEIKCETPTECGFRVKI